MVQFIYILLAIALLLLNAFFVAAEFGMVKLRATKVQAIKSQHGLRGKILEEIHQHLDIYLSACQVGITLASLGLGWIGEPAVARLLEPLFEYLGVSSPRLVTLISFTIAFAIISFLHIVVGELMPKSLAIRRSERVSLWTAIPLYLFYWLMFPAIWLLNTASNFLLRWFGLEAVQAGEKFFSTEEIKIILSSSRLHGEITQAETKIIEQTLEFADLKVTEVMRPADDMVAVSLEQPIDESIQIISSNRFTRYPVYDANHDAIIGFIHIKDLFAALAKKEKIRSLQPFIRPVMKVDHNTFALDLLTQFRKGFPHFALVYKNKDTLLGFMTLDNLLHVLIGRIKDEYHRTHEEWVRNSDGSLTVEGECSIYALEKALHKDITLREDEKNLDILAGLLITRAGHLPQIGENISFAEFEAVVEELQGSQIKQVRIFPHELGS